MSYSNSFEVSGFRLSAAWRSARWLLAGALWAAAGALLAPLAGAAEAPAAAPSDREIERRLERGKVLDRKALPAGVSGSVRVELEHGGETFAAVWKVIDVDHRGLKRFESGMPVLNFTDSYRYEPAAYRLDRQLGLGMVPVAVLRKIGRTRGAMIDWVGDAIDEGARRKQRLEPPDLEAWERQKAVMRLFDALIANTDRNAGNRLITLADWRLHLIDHTRSFRTKRELPAEFLERRIGLPRASLDRLAELDRPLLDELLGSVISPARKESLLARRDLILAAVAQADERQALPAVWD